MNILDELKRIGSQIDPLIESFLVKGVSQEFQDVVLYQVKTGGKRVRPALTILSCEACGGNLEDALPVAAAIELIHEYSLIFDDIIDRGEVRRGKDTLRKKYGDVTAILAGLHYREVISDLISMSKHPLEVRKLLSQTIKDIIEGERLDILFEQAGREDPYILEHRRYNVSFEDYLKMIGLKTAVLISAACEAGCLVADGGSKEREALRAYGYKIGLAFQLIDDLLDIFGEEKVFGKKIGKDLIEHKLGNAVILKSLEELDEKHAKMLRIILSKEKVLKEDVKQAIEIISKTNAKKKVYNLAYGFMEEALQNLKVLPQSSAREKLEILARFIVERKF